MKQVHKDLMLEFINSSMSITDFARAHNKKGQTEKSIISWAAAEKWLERREETNQRIIQETSKRIVQKQSYTAAERKDLTLKIARAAAEKLLEMLPKCQTPYEMNALLAGLRTSNAIESDLLHYDKGDDDAAKRLEEVTRAIQEGIDNAGN